MHPVWVVALPVLLAACAPTHEGWMKTGMTLEMLERDREECYQEARYPDYADPSIPRGVLQSVMKLDPDQFAECMESKGYRRGK